MTKLEKRIKAILKDCDYKSDNKTVKKLAKDYRAEIMETVDNGEDLGVEYLESIEAWVLSYNDTEGGLG